MSDQAPSSLPAPQPPRLWPLSDFEAVDAAQWQRAVEASPSTAAFARKLFTQALEGVSVPALATDRPDSAGALWPLLDLSPRGWRVCATYDAHHLADLAADLTQGGLDAALLQVGAGQLSATLTALAALRAQPAAQRLEVCVCLDAATLDDPNDPDGLLCAWRVEDAPITWRVSLTADALRRGAASADAALRKLAPLVAAGQAPRALCVDVSPFHDAGADAASEVAAALSAALWHLRALTDAGATLDDAARALCFGVSVDTDLFMQAAKLRALRLLWARVTASLGASPDASRVTLWAQTSRRTLTRFDPWCNILRGTLQAAAAVIGGADALAVQPFDALLRPRSAWGRRVARNTQLILREESKLHALIDLGGGSGQIESMTAALCDRAWTHLQALDAAGGFTAALAPAERALAWLKPTADKRAAALSKRLPPIIGVSDFPDLSDLSGHPLPDDALLSAPPSAVALPPVPAPPQPLPPALPLRRDAAPFESIREAVEARASQQAANPPYAWLLCLGPLAQHLPRLNFTANLLAVAGLPSTPSAGLDGADPTAAIAAAVAAFDALPTPPAVVVLCGPDALYPPLVPALAAALRGRAPSLWLAGRPPADLADAFTAAGIDGALFLGCDVPQTLTRLLTKAAIL